MSAVSLHEDDKQGRKDQQGHAMEEKSLSESVRRKRGGGCRARDAGRSRRRDSMSESEQDGSSAEREGGWGAQLWPRGVQELAPALCKVASGVARAHEESAK